MLVCPSPTSIIASKRVLRVGLFSIVSRDTRFINTCKDTYFLQYILFVVRVKDIQVYSSTFYIQYNTVCCLSSSVNKGVIASGPGRESGLSGAARSGAAPLGKLPRATNLSFHVTVLV